MKPCGPEARHCHPPTPSSGSGSPTPALTGPAALAAWFPFLQVSVTLQAEEHQLTRPSGLDGEIRGRRLQTSPRAGGQELETLLQHLVVARSQVMMQEAWAATAA